MAADIVLLPGQEPGKDKSAQQQADGSGPEILEPEQVEGGEDLTGRRPQAWNLELSWQVADRLLLAARYEEADDYQDNARRYGATASYGLCDYALLAVEYLHADADGKAAVHAFTAQLAVEF